MQISIVFVGSSIIRSIDFKLYPFLELFLKNKTSIQTRNDIATYSFKLRQNFLKKSN